MATANAIAALASLRSDGLLLGYLEPSAAITFVSVLCFAFVELTRLAREGADHPLAAVWARLQPRLIYLLLPAMIAPAFFSAYSTMKSAIPFLVGFGWDHFWADLDSEMFGRDAWRLTHAVIGKFPTLIWSFVYAAVWGLVLVFSQSFVTLYASQRTIFAFFLATFLAWTIGGVLLAYSFSAAGPIFAPMFDASLAERFGPLKDSLDRLLNPGNMILTTQQYLAHYSGMRLAQKGGGISAMPSMHLATCSIYVLASKGTRWFSPALLFWCLIFVGSIHFGYHYALDGLIAAVIAYACWSLSLRCFDNLQRRLAVSGEAPMTPGLGTEQQR